MPSNLYANAAQFYDICDGRPEKAIDVDFYVTMIQPTENVLEIGCGTGRVSIPLAERGNRVTGIDLSEPMLNQFREKIADVPSVASRLSLHQLDMRNLDLGQTFDVIIFPFRVFQALTCDEDRRRCLGSVKRHMHENSRVILTLFKPSKSVWENWGTKDFLDLEHSDEATGLTLKRYQSQLWHDPEKQIFSVEFRYEVYQCDVHQETTTDTLELGYLYPDQCRVLFADCGLVIEEAFGSYDRQPLTAEEQKEQIYVLRKR